MYTRKKYKGRDMIRWTKRETRFFFILSTLVAILFEVLGLQWLQIPWTPLAMIGTAVAFLIGFQSNAAYGRIWEARQIWGGIVNDSRAFGIMIKDMITNEYAQTPMSEEGLASAKKVIIYRHIAWITTLRHAMRQSRPWETSKEVKSNQEWREMIKVPELTIPLEEDLKGFLSEEELGEVMRKTNKPAAVLALQSKNLRALKEKGIIWEFSFLELESKIGGLLTHQGKSERIKNFPYPRQFATIGYDFVNLFILLLPLGVIPEFSEIGASFSEKFPLIGRYFVWVGIPFTVVVSWIFNTMQRIGTAGENPFEGGPNDVPISTISRGIEIDLREILDESADTIPEPLAANYDVQM